ncbi:hypothetical protein BASA81_000763 [Batrachochytrium salamandrivorans]|nr:hypothetical protein BASA81_000763 [Batrachochytrium salamandrivorans]
MADSLERLSVLGGRIGRLLDRAARLDQFQNGSRASSHPSSFPAATGNKHMRMDTYAPSTPVAQQQPPQSLRLCVKTGTEEITFKVLSTTKFAKLFNAYGDRKNVDWNQYVFVCMADGRELDPESSAFEQRFLDMQMIECRPRLK